MKLGGSARRKKARQAAGRATKTRKSTTESSRLLVASLGAKLLGQELRTDLYTRNGFRLLGVSACSDRQEVLGKAGRLQTMVRMSPKAVARFAIGTGYEHELEQGDIELCVSRLQDPRHRIVQEVFWPHLSNGTFSSICESKQLTSAGALAEFETLAQGSGGEQEGMLARHALAVAYHNMALANEIKGLTGESSWDGTAWGKALEFWGQVIKDASFWEYLRKRAEAFADPRLRPSDIEQIRSELPSVVLGFNLALSRHYAQSDNAERCRDHLKLIAGSGLPADAVNACLTSAVKALAVMRLEPLVRRAEDPTGAKEKGGKQKEDKFSRKQFEKLYRPILDEVFAVCDYLTGELGLDPKLVALSEFDRICEAILAATNSKIDYDNPDRERDLLYSMLITKQLLSLPLSTHVRRKLESALRSDRRILYRGFEPANSVDVTECWFAEGEEADPDASLVFPYHKITRREVQINVQQGSAGLSVGYESRKVVVPRSKRAKALHEGKKADASSSRRSGGKDSAFSPPSKASVPAFAFGKKARAGSILEVLEFCSKKWGTASKYLVDGSLPDWFDKRGQRALAQKLRACAQGKPNKQETLAVLRGAAAAEIDYAAEAATREIARRVKEKEKEAEKRKRAVLQKRNVDVRAYDERAMARKPELEAEGKAIRAERKTQCAAEQQKTDAAVEEARAAAADGIKEAEQEHERRSARLRGMTGFVRWELPCGGVGVGLGAVAAGFMGSGLLEGLLGAEAPGMVTAVAGGVVLGAGGLVGGGIFRSLARANCARPVTKMKRELDRRCAEILDAGKNRMDKIKAAANEKLAKVKGEWQEIAEGHKRIIQKAEGAVNQISAECDRFVKKNQSEHSQTKRKLEQRLTACFTVKSKGDASSFPALKKAQSNGYKSGNEPSSSDMQMTYAEEQDARTKLQMAMLLRGRF